MTFLEDFVDRQVEKLGRFAKRYGWDAVRNALTGRNRVIVLGSSGVGKTQLLRRLTEQGNAAVDLMNRTRRLRHYSLRLEQFDLVLTDTPGQDLDASVRSRALRRKIGGILNIVAYGYHAYDRSPKDVFSADGSVSEGFLRRHREQEVRLLSEWVPQWYAHPRIWAVTVVNKADIWWHGHESVLDHYTTGAYAKAWSTLGPSGAPDVMPVSARRVRFYGTGSLSPVFDDDTDERLAATLIGKLIDNHLGHSVSA